MKYTLWVEGHPTTKGSLSWFGKGQVVNANERTKTWTDWVRWIWIQSPNYRSLKIETPVKMTLIFYFKRPKTHFNSKGDIKPKYQFMIHPAWKGRLDLDKLSRAIFDAMTGHAYDDDGRIAELHAYKRWGETEGVKIIIEDEDFLDIS